MNEASSLLLPAAVMNSMSGALANAFVSAAFCDVEVLARDLLALVGIAADVAELERFLEALDVAAPAHVDDAHAVLLEEIDVSLLVARIALGELARRARVGQHVPVELDARRSPIARTDCPPS